MQAHFPHLQTEAQADCGHFVPEEKPEAVNRLLAAFLSGAAA